MLEYTTITKETLLNNSEEYYEDFIAKKVFNSNELNQRTLFKVDSIINGHTFDNNDYIVMAGKSEEGVFLWLYNNISIEELENQSDILDQYNIPQYIPKEPIDILSYYNNDKLFS